MATAAKIMTAQYLLPLPDARLARQLPALLWTSAAAPATKLPSKPGPRLRASTACERTLSNLLRIPAANIEVVFVEGSGCYGHNGGDPVTQDAALLSQAVGKPVRVQYSRADEMISR